MLQNAATSLILPPLGVVLAIILLGLLGWRGRRGASLLAALGGVALLVLATPFAANLLAASLDRSTPPAPQDGPAAGAIVILGGDMAHAATGLEVGPLTLERLRAGAALHRRLGLPILVTGGPQREGEASLAALMARSLSEDFGVTARWTEEAARDTRDNADLSAAMLRADGIGAAYLVTHAWHMARAMEAFGRDHYPTFPSAVRHQRPPDGVAIEWLPRPDNLTMTWYALREWLGRAVYAIRDRG